MDGVGLNGEVVAAATHVHVENAGVHSGDATLILPAGPEDVTPYMFKRVQASGTSVPHDSRVTKGSSVTMPKCQGRNNKQ